MLSKSGKSEYVCLVPDLRGNVFSYFSIENDVSCGFAVCGLCYVEIGSLYAHFLEKFYHKWMLNFVKSFFLPSVEVII